jgi:hypothetical protein
MLGPEDDGEYLNNSRLAVLRSESWVVMTECGRVRRRIFRRGRASARRRVRMWLRRSSRERFYAMLVFDNKGWAASVYLEVCIRMVIGQPVWFQCCIYTYSQRLRNTVVL